MGLKSSKHDTIEEVRVQQLPTFEEKPTIIAELEADPENSIVNLNYAIYLAHCDKNYEEAEKYFVYAIEVDKYSARCLGFYALFLEVSKKDIVKAGEMYKMGYNEIICRAQVLGDDEVNFMCNYAIYQKNAMKKPEKAEELYKRLIASNPNHAIAHGDYGILLKDIIKDYEKADNHLKKAAELAPTVPHWQLAYAKFLKFQKKDKKSAKPYFAAAKALTKVEKQKEKERKVLEKKERRKSQKA